jgi:hypothetical protein
LTLEERREMDYLNKEHEEYLKVQQGFKHDVKKQLNKDLLNQMYNDRGSGEQAKMNDKTHADDQFN